MASLQSKITNSLKFLREFYKDASKIYDDCYDRMEKIDKIKESEDKYQNELRKVTKKFKEDMDDFIDEIDMDYRLFNRDFEEIKSNKHDDNVIYSLRDYLEYYDDYKKLYKKKYHILQIKLEGKMDRAYSSKDFGKYLAYGKVRSIVIELSHRVESVMIKCKKITGEKDDEE